MTQARKNVAKRSARKRAWSDLSPREQTGVLVAGSVQLALAATAWADLVKRPAALVNGPKLLWAAIIGLNFVGPIAYFVCGRRKAPSAGPVPAAVTVPAAPLAPAEPDASPTPAPTQSESASVTPVVDEGEPGPVPGLA
ncbi:MULTISPECIES: PLD nuclease N-terminal domain-containing protein [unclassified Cryobacterium]|uniref:PLD nuclease N-terminal domain-containing protein n=1 Tax=unclassified Cryobacterium TaxID=2649013 RepID=UPI002AB45700|nr:MULTISPECIES: PLD nuclease N-terminal domain-containing protein [unclassified Cryobacterium]MDY7529418.1 PLD nuclease N-terminal domain-containing protein [Cryobacterium sp. 10C2]MDY7558432.1 PLD nuclease N-terminal domain-containing protein [Cryobacterium sp. 10C3]MEB0001697.1 PLD nuclease N-terminal domain-containing protein [Cryobacterium sp. RTC2.1]MEB0201672.1 PLD nuclease N-terminal domain-containing protein [Cryobacterium sp. 5I3]MEB0286730.1 PLD nuclease N-terminal domain-containing